MKFLNTQTEVKATVFSESYILEPSYNGAELQLGTHGLRLSYSCRACWLHSHPDEQNVYDFTKYASFVV